MNKFISHLYGVLSVLCASCGMVFLCYMYSLVDGITIPPNIDITPFHVFTLEILCSCITFFFAIGLLSVPILFISKMVKSIGGVGGVIVTIGAFLTTTMLIGVGVETFTTPFEIGEHGYSYKLLFYFVIGVVVVGVCNVLYFMYNLYKSVYRFCVDQKGQ